ncbi:Pheromone-regulated membrane protein 10 [Madurella mycetomatis]|uniref:Pheromone-regulated membrane protein 10 n=1 Tax=Madurella mycetomatis TaxID=100816 RepID=A0A175W7Y7_9PEZI|nr:Pheromone-regulated membrane protein 10 [Madurella mycetomatis]
MAAPQTPHGQAMPGAAGGEQRQDSPQSSSDGLPPPKGKEKKRVGFVSDKEPQTATSASPLFLTPDEPQAATRDYFSYNPTPYSHGSTPLIADGPTKRDSFNRDELAAALEQILGTEQEASPVLPRQPRPVLRKSTTLPSPADALTAPHPSEVEAKNRADRLAYSVGTSSVPVANRGSVDSEKESTLDRDILPDDSTTTMAQDLAPPGHSGTLQPRKTAQTEADELVKAHKHRKSPLIQSFTPPRSGAVTPIDHDLEYVPRPEKYRGGILGTLLRLHNSDDKHGGTAYLDVSGSSTPARTPNASPSSTPPASRSSTPRPDRGRRSWRAQSSGTLAGLMESSFMFAAPGSSKDISEAVSEKVKHEKERAKKPAKSKKKLEEYRIKIHIAEIIKRHAYLLKLCHALMMYGAPTHRLEAYMRMSARVLGIEGQFMYLPDTMIISFDDSNTHTTEVKIVRTTQGLDFGRLRDVHEIYKKVVHDLIGVEEATAHLDEVMARKPKFPKWLRVLLYGVASAMVAPFGFEGRYIDMPICFILGCLVGFLQLYLAPSNELYANVFEITAAVATSFLARVFGSLREGALFCFSSLAQASIALILPGYMVLCASLELQSHQMVSGSVRMVYALIYTLFLGYGFTIGSVLYGYMDDNAVSSIHCSVGDRWYTQRPPENFYILFVFAFTLCLCAINQAKWKQTPVQVLISLAGFLVNNFSSRFFRGNGIISSSLGALTIGVLANLYSRLGRFAQNWSLDVWEYHVGPRLRHLSGKRRRPHESPYQNCPPATDSEETVAVTASASVSKEQDVEMGTRSQPSIGPFRHARKIGYGLAAAAMLPAIFVQVPSGLAASGSLLSGVTSADQITRNETILANGTVINGTLSTTTTAVSGDLNSSAFSVLVSVIQVAINISVGLSLSALLVYPFGKRRSGLFSF